MDDVVQAASYPLAAWLGGRRVYQAVPAGTGGMVGESGEAGGPITPGVPSGGPRHVHRRSSLMRIAYTIVAATIIAAVSSIPGIRAAAQEMIVMEGAPMPGGCGCQEAEVQRPPWHGTVASEACGCGPVGRVHGKFHANSCGQWHAKHHLPPGVCLPPAFPRLQAWCTQGSMPTPPPLELPRCHQCGAVIAGGF